MDTQDFGQLSYTNPVSQYIGQPVEDVAKANEMVYQRYLLNKDIKNKLEDYISTIQVDNAQKGIKDRAFEKLVNTFAETVSSDSYEYADKIVDKAARDLKSDKLLNEASQLHQMRLAEIENARKIGVSESKIQAFNQIYELSSRELELSETGEVKNQTYFRRLSKDPNIVDKAVKLIGVSNTNKEANVGYKVGKYQYNTLSEAQSASQESGQPIQTIQYGTGINNYTFTTGSVEYTDDAKLFQGMQAMLASDPEVRAYIEDEMELFKYSHYAIDPETGKYARDENDNFIDGSIKYDMNGNKVIVPHDYIAMLPNVGLSEGEVNSRLAQINSANKDERLNALNLELTDDVAKLFYYNKYQSDLIDTPAMGIVNLNSHVKREMEIHDNKAMLLDLEYMLKTKLEAYKKELEKEIEQTTKVMIEHTGNPDIPNNVKDFKAQLKSSLDAYDSNLSKVEDLLRIANGSLFSKNSKLVLSNDGEKEGINYYIYDTERKTKVKVPAEAFVNANISPEMHNNLLTSHNKAERLLNIRQKAIKAGVAKLPDIFGGNPGKSMFDIGKNFNYFAGSLKAYITGNNNADLYEYDDTFDTWLENENVAYSAATPYYRETKDQSTVIEDAINSSTNDALFVDAQGRNLTEYSKEELQKAYGVETMQELRGIITANFKSENKETKSNIFTGFDNLGNPQILVNNLVLSDDKTPYKKLNNIFINYSDLLPNYTPTFQDYMKVQLENGKAKVITEGNLQRGIANAMSNANGNTATFQLTGYKGIVEPVKIKREAGKYNIYSNNGTLLTPNSSLGNISDIVKAYVQIINITYGVKANSTEE